MHFRLSETECSKLPDDVFCRRIRRLEKVNVNKVSTNLTEGRTSKIEVRKQSRDLTNFICYQTAINVSESLNFS